MVRGDGVFRFGPVLFGSVVAWMLGTEFFPAVSDAQVQIQIQRPVRRQAAPSGDGMSGIQAELRTDRSLSRGLRLAQERIAAGEYSEAVQFLDDVLGRSDDYFLESTEDSEVAGLKETAARAIRDLPPAGQTAYRAAFASVAERLLTQALAEGDASGIEQIAYRYFYTPAGMEAALMHAINLFDSGRGLDAALTYGRLLESPEAAARFDPELSVRAAACWFAVGDQLQAADILARLDRSGESGRPLRVTIAGEERGIGRIAKATEGLSGLPETTDSRATGSQIEWLRRLVGVPRAAQSASESTGADWLVFRGDIKRTATSQGGLPHMRERWRVRLLHPRLASIFNDLSAEMHQEGTFSPVASAPLAIGNVVLVRTPHQVLAVDFGTGKRIWQAEVTESSELEQLIDQGVAGEEEVGAEHALRFVGREENGDQHALAAFAQRMWYDYLYQLMSSDGHRVFTVGGFDVAPSIDLDIWPNGPLGLGGFASPTNRLTALDLATEGKRIWEIRGAAEQGDLAGAFFLGAPAPVGASLYVLVEIKNAIHLAALDAATGDLEWLQQLASLETGIGFDATRRLQSIMPSYGGGILVCPTSAGVVIGVDVASRALVWAYRYVTPQRLPPYGSRDEDARQNPLRQWLNDAPAIVDGRVVLTPIESPFVHCIELRTGKLLWQKPRGEMLQLASADSKRVVLMGNRAITALNLVDGEPIWNPAVLAFDQSPSSPGNGPTGNGFANGSSYFVPLASSEVAEIDLATGRIVGRAAARDGIALGNLVAHDGALLSHDGRTLDRFDQIDVLRARSIEQLAASPNDPMALRTLGEIAYNEGRLSEAIRLLEQALRFAPTDFEVRDVLADSLAAALNLDFAAFRSRIDLLDKLQASTPGKRIATLRIRSQGLLAEGDLQGAADACLELYRDLGEGDERLEIDRTYSTSASRWGRAQLGEIWRQANDDVRTHIAESVARLLHPKTVDPLDELPESTHAASFFGELPLGQELVWKQAQQLAEEGRPLAAQQLMLDLVECDDPLIRSPARQRADQLLVDARLGVLTGNEPKQWPQGNVAIAESARAPQNSPSGATNVPQWGVRLERTDSVLGQCTLLISHHGNGELIVHDPLGREILRTAIDRENRGAYREQGSVYAVSRGSLLIVSLGRQIFAVDTLGAASVALEPILWRANMLGQLENRSQVRMFDRTGGVGRPGSHRASRTARDGHWIGVIGPLTSHGCVFQEQGRLVSVDPLSGAEVWSRSDVPLGCDLFGDDDLVFAVPRGSSEALVFSAIDGRSLGKRATPTWNETLATQGRCVKFWKKADSGGLALGSIDLFSQQMQWSRQFAAGSCVNVAQGRFAVVAQTDGRIVVVDLDDGSFVVDYAGERVPDVDQVHLLTGSQAMTVVVSLPRNGAAQRKVNPFVKEDYPLISGKVYAFDRKSGKMMWHRPAEIDQQCLALTQPVDLPLLAFVGTVQVQRAGGSSPKMTILALDKRTGKTLLRRDDLPQAGGSQCVFRIPDARSNVVAAETTTRVLNFSFTDAPTSPMPPAMDEVEANSGKTSRGLMGIFENMTRGR